ncbi:hypothetical protein N752_14960 [Desulforamulus aquiferis]|nr:response regulator [Desulforamulus aquiferis]RYD04670.1 hypothetical protein N752_14960 [Desulforamulus aquiferis]
MQQNLLHELANIIGVTINRVAGHMQVQKLLKESQELTEELQIQSEELQLQQEELKTFNEKLEEQYRESEQRTKELEKIKADLEDKAYQLEQASRYKSEFLANMSHELRTPLNSMLILSQLLAENQQGNLTEKQMEYARTIITSGNDLLQLINEVLDLAKIESGKMDINQGRIRLIDIKDFAERHFIPVANKKRLNFETIIDHSLPEIVYTDEHRLEQILFNLLSNAFKFTEKGSVVLTIRLADEKLRLNTTLEAEQFMIAISVTDTGIGIPPEKQELIFEAFCQADGTTSRKYGGTGLGLSISRELAGLLGGFIDVKSNEEGSTFTLYLPVHSQDSGPDIIENESQELVKPVEQSQAFLKGKKILIVDDDVRNIFAVTTALENHQVEVYFAENGREGLDMLELNPDIDLILMDIMMPNMDGYEAIKAIRNKPEYDKLPIIALTAKTMKADREQCFSAGASDYITKPINTEQLMSMLRVWLYRMV